LADPWLIQASRLPYRRTIRQDRVSAEAVDIRLEATPSSRTGPRPRMAGYLSSPTPTGKLQRTTGMNRRLTDLAYPRVTSNYLVQS